MKKDKRGRKEGSRYQYDILEVKSIVMNKDGYEEDIMTYIPDVKEISICLLQNEDILEVKPIRAEKYYINNLIAKGVETPDKVRIVGDLKAKKVIHMPKKKK